MLSFALLQVFYYFIRFTNLMMVSLEAMCYWVYYYGIISYLIIFSKTFIKINVIILSLAKKILKFIVKIFSFPVKLLIYIVKKVLFIPIFFIFINIRKKITSILKKAQKICLKLPKSNNKKKEFGKKCRNI